MSRKTVHDLVMTAKDYIEELSVAELQDVISSGSCTVVDIRDFRERLLDGTIPNSLSAPSGMDQWWFDHASP